MGDMFTKEKRSEIMSRITSKDTKYEVMVRKWLFSHGFRYRKNDKRYPGKPDIVLPKYKTAIFINGCFWHGHENCKFFRLPKSRPEYWHEKLKRNTIRDKENIKKLNELGFHVIIVWECELKKNPELRLDLLIKEINNNHK